MMKAVRLFASLVLGLLGFDCLAALPEIPASYVMEMRPLPLSGYGPLTRSCAVDPGLLSSWPEVYPQVLSFLDREQIVAMSGWSQAAMQEHYVFSPDLQAQPVAYGCNDLVQVLEVVVETLPIHAPCVTRWLKAFLVLDRAEPSQFLEILYTIQGERQE